MTKQEFLMLHPDVKLTMAPITGGADICLSDYMDSLCSNLFTGKIEDATVFSYENRIVLLRESENEITLRMLHGNLSDCDKQTMLSRLFEYGNVSDVADEFEDWTVAFFISQYGNVFMPDWYESRAELHNDGHIRCIYVGDKSAIALDKRDIQNYLEHDNDDPECQTVCTTEQEGNDVKFEWWYKESINE